MIKIYTLTSSGVRSKYGSEYRSTEIDLGHVL